MHHADAHAQLDSARKTECRIVLWTHGLTVPRQDFTTPAQSRPEVAETSLFHIRLQLIKDLHHNNQIHTDYTWHVATTTTCNQVTIFDFDEPSLSPTSTWVGLTDRSTPRDQGRL